ncbi:ROK family protein [Anaerolineales bacterium HSG24]|nr:ROK family protein [Anaerolineales bacterium HSG24]
MTAKNKQYLAFDFGGTKLSVAIGKTGRLNQKTIFSPPKVTATEQYRLMVEMAQHLLVDNNASPIGIGVSFGGPVQAEKGIVRISYHVPGWEGFPLAARLKAQFGLQGAVVIDNDANTAALGEFCFGAGQGCQSLLYVTVSTGIGGGWIINGQPFHGADGLAGEIGHIQIESSSSALPCNCGRHGCLEAEACGLAIAQRAKLYLKNHPEHGQRLRDLVEGKLYQLSAAHVSQAASEGDQLSWQVLKVAATQLGRGLAQALNMLNPERIILGGGVIKAGEVWWQTVRETAQEYTLQGISVNIHPAELGDDATLWGAMALARKM